MHDLQTIKDINANASRMQMDPPSSGPRKVTGPLTPTQKVQEARKVYEAAKLAWENATLRMGAVRHTAMMFRLVELQQAERAAGYSELTKW